MRTLQAGCSLFQAQQAQPSVPCGVCDRALKWISIPRTSQTSTSWRHLPPTVTEADRRNLEDHIPFWRLPVHFHFLLKEGTSKKHKPLQLACQTKNNSSGAAPREADALRANGAAAAEASGHAAAKAPRATWQQLATGRAMSFRV